MSSGSKFNLDSSKGKISDIEKKLDEKSDKKSSLEKGRESVNEAQESIRGLGLEDSVEQSFLDKLSEQQSEIDEQRDQLYSEIDEAENELNEILEETKEETEKTEQGKSSLEAAKKVLENDNLGAALESGLSEAERRISELSDFQNETSKVHERLAQLKGDIHRI